MAARNEEGTLVFAEVALSEDPRDGFPPEGSPSALRRRMEAASIAWLAKRGGVGDARVRFDQIAIVITSADDRTAMIRHHISAGSAE